MRSNECHTKCNTRLDFRASLCIHSLETPSPYVQRRGPSLYCLAPHCRPGARTLPSNAADPMTDLVESFQIKFFCAVCEHHIAERGKQSPTDLVVLADKAGRRFRVMRDQAI